MANRLTSQDWITHGFEVLKAQGHEGLKADRMARALKVSRGSFYWHFADLDAFHLALIKGWSAAITEAQIADLATLPADAQLETLIARVLTNPQRLEAAIRRWAGADARVADAVAQVDTLRIGYLRELLQGHGLPPAAALSRAQFINWGYVGFALAPLPVDAATMARDLAAAFTTKDHAHAHRHPDP
ncbi:hypothetical protein ACMU_08680 [Actibacterium mucosum KCTC 23349]|uniref:Uncharacterized protein n=1 Tax=Actibacterium mucosum KCTC 23349 TaxID=1454373 RepID=A0A037ZIA9_9RHOB|nr:TetR/AcrR family transcriptional regulator [Actibacterium mucosum]KAJ55838.1 hypothetical protein ACMU_08680 [Actibacterium mucosum KCTC 23349]